MRYLFGRWESSDQPMSVEEIQSLLDEAENQRAKLANYPEDKIFRIFSKLHTLWKNPEYKRRKKLMELLPEATSFSPEMIRLGLEELASTLDPKVLEKKLTTEFHRFTAIGNGHFDPKSQTWITRQPLGIVLHILSGNVFLVGLGSLVEGLLCRNVTLLKMSSEEKLFLPELLGSLCECDPDGVVARSIATLDYPSSHTELISALKQRIDGLVVWGGEEAVRAYRRDLPARVRVVVFGPKLSLAFVSQKGIEHFGAKEITDRIATEVAVWDQNACTSPQICFVEDGPHLEEFCREIPQSFKERELSLPPGPTETNTAVEIQKLRGYFEIAEARGQGSWNGSKKQLNWTLVFDRNTALETSPLQRTLRIVPVADASVVIREVESFRNYVQTVGIACAPVESMQLSENFSLAGALRIVELGGMCAGEIDDPHDGAYDLPQLVNFVITRLPLPSKSVHPADIAPAPLRQEWINSRLRRLIDEARLSPFYEKRVSGLTIDTTDDLPKIPILTRREMEAGMPPESHLLATGVARGGYVSRSGGSTGKPKFSFYDGRDWEASMSEAVRVLRSSGLEEGDRLANCFLSGDLYGSFVSFDHINARLGVTNFAFSGKVDHDLFLQVWKHFQLNAIQGVPSTVVPLLRDLKKKEPDLALDKFIFAGTPISTEDQKWLRENLRIKRVSSVIGANDGNQLAYQCEYLQGRMHHLIDDYNFVEIVDEEDRLVPDGESGRIVITSLRKFAYPLIRYEIGDAGRIVPHYCPCGRTVRTLEYLGRADDMICIGNMNVAYRDIADAIKDLPVTALQVAGGNSGGGEYLLLRVESEAEVTEQVKKMVLAKITNIRERVSDGSLSEVRVENYRPGKLERNPRTGKLKAMTDERL